MCKLQTNQQKLKDWLDARGMRQNFFAEKIEISPVTLSKIMKGGTPSLKTALKIEEQTKRKIAAGDWISCAD